MMLSEKELNCMKICHKAPNCTDISNFSRGSMPIDTLRVLATYGARVHAFCASKQSHKLSNLVAKALSIDRYYFWYVKVCQVHNDSAESILL